MYKVWLKINVDGKEKEVYQGMFSEKDAMFYERCGYRVQKIY